MALASSTKEYSTFVNGLITEASALTYPENASIDEENFTLNRDGSRRRRQGIDYENSYSLSSSIAEGAFSDQSVGCYLWKNPSNSGLYQFVVVQVGDTIHFYDNTQSSISANKKSFTIDLNTYKTPTASTVGDDPIDVTVGKGNLFIVSKTIEPIMVEYSPPTAAVNPDTISVTQLTLKIRDFLGVEDDLDVDDNPTTLTDDHHYNLLNQGWSTAQINSYYSSQSAYPSNAQVWTEGKDSSDVFQPSELVKTYFGTTPAPKGHYVLDAFTRDRATVSGLSSMDTEEALQTETNRPSTVAFYAGRVFYSGVESERDYGPTLNSYVYYSRILDSSHSLQDDVSNCYQEADPTSETISDLVATDGGVIRIPEAGIIRKLIPIVQSLLVIADNGVWAISGDLDTGFSATTNQVIKITDIGAVNKNSVVVVENSVLFWSDGGIYIIQPDERNQLNATNITQTTIQSFYNDDIPSVSKLYAVGSYDSTSKKVSWLYNADSGYDGATYRNRYNRELILDTVLGSFYKNKVEALSSNSPYIYGYINTPSSITSTRNIDVQASAVDVEASADQVIVSENSPGRGTVSTKYLTVVPVDASNSQLTFSLYNNNSFKDWETKDSTGVDFSSYLITGYDLFQDSMRFKQVPYLVMHFNVTETGYTADAGVGLNFENPSSCLVRVRWDWSNSSASNRWGSQFEAYRLNKLYIPADVNDTFDYGFDTISTKNKIRGKGRSFSLRVDSSSGKDMHLIGWAINLVGVTEI